MLAKVKAAEAEAASKAVLDAASQATDTVPGMLASAHQPCSVGGSAVQRPENPGQKVAGKEAGGSDMSPEKDERLKAVRARREAASADALRRLDGLRAPLSPCASRPARSAETHTVHLGAAAPVTGAAADEYNLNVVDCNASVTVARRSSISVSGGLGGTPSRRRQEQCALVEESDETPATEKTLDAEAKDASNAVLQVAEPVEEAVEPAPESSSGTLLLTEMLSKYDLEDEVDLLGQNGIKKDLDLEYLDEDLIKDMTLTPVSKAKLRRIAKALRERSTSVDESEAVPVTEETLYAEAKDESGAGNPATEPVVETTETVVAGSEGAEGVEISLGGSFQAVSPGDGAAAAATKEAAEEEAAAAAAALAKQAEEEAAEETAAAAERATDEVEAQKRTEEKAAKKAVAEAEAAIKKAAEEAATLAETQTRASAGAATEPPSSSSPAVFDSPRVFEQASSATLDGRRIVEAKRLGAEAAAAAADEDEGDEDEDDEDDPSVLTISDHPHDLHYSQSLRHHCCDLCNTDIKKPHGGYRCSDGCDFDVCMKCAKAYIKEAEDDEEDDDEDEEEEEEQQAMKYGGDLCMIADLGDASKVQTFLSVSNVQTFINYQDTDGHTPLFKAAKKGHAAVVDQLIAARCNVDLANTDDGQTPLFIAAEQGHTPVVEQLIAARCSLNLVSAVRRLYYREREKCLCIHMRVIGGGGTGGERVYTLHLKPSPPHAKH
jgi:hypothetical protein